MPKGRGVKKAPKHAITQDLMLEAKRMAGLPEGAPEQSVARKLLEKGAVFEAVDFLFGTTPELAKRHMVERDFRLYLALRAGEQRVLLKEMVEHCHWQKPPEKDGLTIQVYPGEWLRIECPVSKAVQKAIIGW